MEIIIYKALVLLSLATFLFYGYDMRKKNNATNVISAILTKLMKLIAIILGIIFICFTLVLVNNLYITDYVSILLLISGANIVRSSKKKLVSAQAFTWTGYVLDKPNLVSDGIYSYIRHPLYTGVFLVEIAGCLSIIPRYFVFFPHYAIIFLILTIVSVGYAMAFNIIAANIESEYLKSKFANQYIEYSKNVHSFIPFFHKIKSTLFKE